MISLFPQVFLTCVLSCVLFHFISVIFMCLIVLSHWPHVATQVEQQVAELVAQLVSENVAGTVHTGHIVEQQVATHF